MQSHLLCAMEFVYCANRWTSINCAAISILLRRFIRPLLPTTSIFRLTSRKHRNWICIAENDFESVQLTRRFFRHYHHCLHHRRRHHHHHHHRTQNLCTHKITNANYNYSNFFQSIFRAFLLGVSRCFVLSQSEIIAKWICCYFLSFIFRFLSSTGHIGHSYS